MNNPLKKFKPTANQRAAGCLAHAIMWAVIAPVLIFADVMFVSLLWDAFPSGTLGGFLTACAVSGAFATSISMIGLVIAKDSVFRPGAQVWAAWAFTGLEIIVMILNVVTALARAHGNLGILAYWLDYGAPATPFVAVIGWILIRYLDPSRAQAHARMEMEDEKAESQLDYERAEHEAHMTVKHEFLKAYQGFLLEEATAHANLEKLREGARRMSQSVISGIIGSPIGIPASNIVDSTLASQSETPVLQAKKEEAKETGPLAETVSMRQEAPIPSNGNGAKPREHQEPV